MSRASIVDVSRYQGTTDAARIKAAGFCGMVARCTIGLREDGSAIGRGLDFYHAHQDGARANGLIFGAYHVLWPSNRAPVAEANEFWDKCGDIDLVVLDAEVLAGMSLAQAQDQAHQWLRRMQELTDKRLFLYTGSWWWTAKAGWERDFALWEAEYWLSQPRGGIDRTQQYEAPNAPSPSAGWDKATMWQWTSGGKPLGAQSESMDYSVFMPGDETAFREFLGLGTVPPPPPPQVPEITVTYPAGQVVVNVVETA